MKNTTQVDIVADSVYVGGNRLTTFQLRYPREIHAELLTHAMFSRNAASSRAIPTEIMIKSIVDDPFIPSIWIMPHKGMKGKELHDLDTSLMLHEMYMSQMKQAIDNAYEFHKAGAAKEPVNRRIENYGYIDVIVTAEHTEDNLYNFFNQRCPKYPKEYDYLSNSDRENYLMSSNTAKWEMQVLAHKMMLACQNSTPIVKRAISLHIPYANDTENVEAVYNLDDNVRKAVVRCARVSYMNHLEPIEDSVLAYKKYCELNSDNHESPFEHVCKMVGYSNIFEPKHKKHKGKFNDWEQLRHMTEYRDYLAKPL